MGLTGQLSEDIQGLSELQTLDLSYNNGLTGSLPQSIGNLTKLSNLILVSCGFSGRIPETIGSLQQLSILTLSSNSFSGPIPPSIGNLFNLYWLDLSVNKLSGTIPVSPGLDMLVNAKHFHCGSNQLSGEIPSQLFKSNVSDTCVSSFEPAIYSRVSGMRLNDRTTGYAYMQLLTHMASMSDKLSW